MSSESSVVRLTWPDAFAAVARILVPGSVTPARRQAREPLPEQNGGSHVGAERLLQCP